MLFGRNAVEKPVTFNCLAVNHKLIHSPEARPIVLQVTPHP